MDPMAMLYTEVATDDLNHELKEFPNGNDLETGENNPENDEDEPGCIKAFLTEHAKIIRIIKYVVLLLFLYSYTIAARILNPEHSEKLVALVIFGTVCGVLYGIYLLVLSYDPPNIVEVFEKKVPKIQMILGIIVGVLFLALVIFFIVDSPKGYEKFRKRKAQALLGLLLYVLLCYVCSKDRSKVRWRCVLWGLGIQYVFAMLILKTKPGEDLFDFIGDQTTIFLNYARKGGLFVFGDVAMQGAYEGDVPVAHRFGYSIWSFSILIPTVVFFSAFVSILFHLGVLQVIIMGISKLMFYTMQTSVVESLNAAGNIFVGMTEAPLMIRPFLPRMTNSEIHAVMTGGFATIAGGVLAAYIGMGIPAKHLIAASVMSCPAALAISKLVYPEREKSEYASGQQFVIPKLEDAKNFIEAAKNGAAVSIGLCANIIVMLIAFISFYDCFQTWFRYFALCVNWDITFTELIGYIFVPFAWMLGIEESQCQHAGELLALKILVNEYVAYATLAQKLKDNLINTRTEVLMTYALCGFGNISSMGIQVGALSVMAPSRKSDLAKLVVSAMLAGTVACQMTACIAGILLDVE
ncbi:solute carrier family 28 member 3-like isoform X3 [Bolinopsis microptera]|uniref:solute carrier family 28 member 3-like isoform X3 n=1 Tax=Bolinopsis microptera TaxID=2820187 RepID=UPI00307901EC